MRVPRLGVVPVALLALVLVGCATGASTPPTPTESATGATATPPEALVGSYSVEYHTTESDREPVTDETVVRKGEVTGSCTDSQCDLAFTSELKAADGSITSGVTALTVEGATYHGTQTSTFSCDGFTSLTTVAAGLEYTSETRITPSATTVKDGSVVVTTFDIVTVEHNELTAAGRKTGCLKINPSGPDPYVSNATTVGVGTRQE